MMIPSSHSLVHSPIYRIAHAALEAGISVLPIRPDGSKQPALSGWREYQRRLPLLEEVQEWFRHPYHGLALVTGAISGGLIALDFDDADTFYAWRERVRADRVLNTLYTSLASGYEERTPKGGRHILFRCPEAFRQERRPGNQKLALRPVPPPQRYETLAETREEGGLIIVYPSHGSVHPSGKPYYLLRGSVAEITTITAAQRDSLYASVRTYDETPKDERSVQQTITVVHPHQPQSVIGERPGDLFNADSRMTWEHLLDGWELIGSRENGVGHREGYWRHPGKQGSNHSATTNADGTDRLFVFSPSVGLPMGRYLSKFEYFAYWHWGGDFKAAARDLAEQGYTRNVLLKETTW